MNARGDRCGELPYKGGALFSDVHPSDNSMDASHRIIGLEASLKQATSELAKARDELKRTQSDLEKLRHAYRRVLEQLALMRKRLFAAKSERKDTTAEQLVFDGLLAEAALLVRALEAAKQAEQTEQTEQAEQAEQAEQNAIETPAAPDSPNKDDEPRPKPKGRRNLADSTLPVVRVEITDPELEGKAERIGFEESSRLGYERGGARHIIVARAVYKVEDDAATRPSTEGATTSAEGEKTQHEHELESTPTSLAVEQPVVPTVPDDSSQRRTRLITAPLPKELFRRGLLAPSMIAYLLAAKYTLGLPFYRIEQQFTSEGAGVDRGTMCRYAEDAGATLGAIVLAARDEAFAESFCLSTDATGISIQPTPIADGTRQPCRKGHFFVVLADRDHVFFEYQAKHTSVAVSEMFKGFSGYIQADAHAVYDALFRGPVSRDADSGPELPKEVGCWSHGRRKFWEAAVCKHRLGVEGLARVNAIFAADKPLWKLSPAKRHALRQQYVRPLVDSFFEWAKATLAVTTERGLVATALGYAVRQEAPLRRFLEDGRLRLENNASERALRHVAIGRKNWLFCGSDDHASAAANLFSLVASCKLHALDPEAYLADVIRVMPYWPRDRYLDLAPKYWARTRARLDPTELARPLGHVSVPGPLPPEEQQLPR